jgi:phospho-N-acetylmuramoyl-pentapeptide-transferase
MIYLLVNSHLSWLSAHHLGFLRVLINVTFRSTAAVILGCGLVLLLGPGTIAWLRRQRIGDLANFDEAQMNKLMEGKKGIPTMGGILIIFAIAVTVLLLADLENFYVRMAVICVVWLGGVGAVDDWLKLTSVWRAAKAKALAADAVATPETLVSAVASTGSSPAVGATSAAPLPDRPAQNRAGAENGAGARGNADGQNNAGGGNSAGAPNRASAEIPASTGSPSPAAAQPPASRQGLTSLEKLLFQVGLGILLSLFTYHYSTIATSHTLYAPFFKNFALVLGPLAFAIIGTIVITGTSNAVNLTDGLDGLAAGCAGIVSFTFLILALIQGYSFDTEPLAKYLFLPVVPGSAEMAVVAGAMVGACLGFLWFNCHPASVFMGDTGSLALGGLLGYISIVIRQELLLFLCGGIFVVEAMSVMLQVGYFKYTKRKFGAGRRIFLMAPLHHHFQKKGWHEVQVVIRFWLIGVVLAMIALATIKLR